MTTKAPAAPKTAPKTTPKSVETPEITFWKIIKEIRDEVKKEGFGKKAAGRDFKDTDGLKRFVRPLFDKYNIHYYISPKDVHLLPTQHINKSGSLISHYIVHGTYDVKWFLNGEIVFETTAYGSTNIESASMATQGSLTNATTSALYTLLQAETQSDEEYQQKIEQSENRQAPRDPAQTYGYGTAPQKTGYGY